MLLNLGSSAKWQPIASTYRKYLKSKSSKGKERKEKESVSVTVSSTIHGIILVVIMALLLAGELQMAETPGA
jgi:purine-cytosine permease-like protein